MGGVRHDLHALAADQRRIVTAWLPLAARAVKEVAEDGNRFAKADARRTAGKVGKHYPKAFSAESTGITRYEWGPDASMPQGGMDFEHGRGRQTAPHHNIKKGADRHGAPQLARKAKLALDSLPWT